jgi:hypothetical protein
MRIEMYDFPEIQRELLCQGKHPQAEAYFDLAYRAIMDGDSNLAREYLLKTVEAVQKGIVLTVLDGQKPLNEDYDYSKRAKLEVMP